MKYFCNRNCQICGLHKGHGFNHEKCSKILQKLMNKSCEKRNNKTINNTKASRIRTRKHVDFILSKESFNEIL